jgi:hypothetical protein
MHVQWTILPKGDIPAHWSGVYVSLNRHGRIAMNRVAYSRAGEPAAFQILFDKVNSRIALKPTALSMKHAYPATKKGRHGGRIICAFRLLKEFGIKIDETIEFKDPEVDYDGQLILDLRTARVSPRGRKPRS